MGLCIDGALRQGYSLTTFRTIHAIGLVQYHHRQLGAAHLYSVDLYAGEAST